MLIGERGFNIDMRGNIVSSWWSKTYGNVFDDFELSRWSCLSMSIVIIQKIAIKLKTTPPAHINRHYKTL